MNQCAECVRVYIATLRPLVALPSVTNARRTRKRAVVRETGTFLTEAKATWIRFKKKNDQTDGSALFPW